MSDEPTSSSVDFGTWLSERGPDAYALAWVSEATGAVGVDGAPAPTVGESGIAGPGADLTRLTLHEVTHGLRETVHRWLQLDDGHNLLAIVSAPTGVLREHTPGELGAELRQDPDTDDARLTGELAGWLYRRYADAPQGLELGWVAAAAAWSCHMRALTGYPPPSVLSASLERADEDDDTIEDLVVSTGLKIAGLLDRLEHAHRPRSELIEDWRAVQSLAADVPALTELAGWLLDQIALRDAPAQRLRAVLEPDITDYLRDQQAADPGTAPALDAQRAEHLAQGRQTVRAYTAAAHTGREQEAQQLLDSFPAPARTLTTSGPARTWRQHSTTAQEAVEALAAQRNAITTEDSTDYVTDPELLHAHAAYLTAREGQLHRIHDALGCLAFPTPAPRDLPEALAPVATAQIQRRVIEAFGTPERAAQALDGQIHYQLQQLVPAHQRAQTGAETDLLTCARDALQHLTNADVPLDAEQIRARLEQAMARPTAAEAPGSAAPTAHDEAHAQALTAASTTPEIHR
ncbi:hypothetical protein [Streptomyces collinus]|uniref:hypothetical protein n=1 Tax=Streptomyces collinus TaxID=42684 RepID=UPI0033D6DAC5